MPKPVIFFWPALKKRRWPGIDPVERAHSEFVEGMAPHKTDDASLLLEFYKSKHGETPNETPQLALASLAELEGRFAFVLYDAAWTRVIAGRDPGGLEELYWCVLCLSQLCTMKKITVEMLKGFIRGLEGHLRRIEALKSGLQAPLCATAHPSLSYPIF